MTQAKAATVASALVTAGYYPQVILTAPNTYAAS